MRACATATSWLLKLLFRGLGVCWRSIPLGRLFGVPVMIHSTWFILPGCQFVGLVKAGLFSAQESVLLALGFCASLLAHEFAHVLVARFFGIGTHRVLLFPLGAVAMLEDDPDEVELWVALAGPLMSAAIALGLWGALVGSAGSFPLAAEAHPVACFLLVCNALFALFNLLPCLPLDGGRVLRSALVLVIGWCSPLNACRAKTLATRITVRWISLPVALGMMVLTVCVTHLWSHLLLFPVVILIGEFEYLMAREQCEAAPVVLDRLLLPGHRRLWNRLPERKSPRAPVLVDLFRAKPTGQIIQQPAT